MARIPRAVAVGVAHHVTQRVNRERVFFTNSDRRTYFEWLVERAHHARPKILAYCLMDNHIHLVAVSEEPESLATAVAYSVFEFAAPCGAPLAEPLSLVRDG